ncbi:hypothetical protein [Breoghania sp. L-A4]|uniref:hypothetical protein n=1 Tax=Breoghania sp. L-A4 TaxID=2304600 RepID=UPI0019682F5D|nr:hypothetical protein [Breoghania sp. L-A4]
MQALDFAAGFAPGTQADWQQLVEKALKGASFDRLRSVTDGGLPIEPLYSGRRDVAAVSGRPAAQPWTVVTRIAHPSPAVSNSMILEDLDGAPTVST